MELLKPNFLDTTTGFTVQSNTATAAYLFDRDPTFQYVSSGFNSDLTTTTIRVNFAETMTVDRLVLMGMNFRDFDIYYNGATANGFALTTTGSTVTSKFSSNSETSMFLRCTPTFCTSVTLDIRKTIAANAEKAIGYLYVGQTRLDFPRDPGSKDYAPKQTQEGIVHKMSDGGTRIQQVSDKWAVDIKLANIDLSFRNSLRDIYRLHDSHVFCPFGTTTAWDEIVFPCVWEGDFDFYRYTDDAPGAGYSGSMRLRETTR